MSIQLMSSLRFNHPSGRTQLVSLSEEVRCNVELSPSAQISTDGETSSD